MGGRPPLVFYDSEMPSVASNSAIPLLGRASMANTDVRRVLIDTGASEKLCSDEIADFQGSDRFDAFISNEKIQACTIYYTILYDNFIQFDSWLTLIYSVYDFFLDMPSVGIKVSVEHDIADGIEGKQCQVCISKPKRKSV
ncbi:hypothetical protein MTR_8g442570 [Medicago truncatula]|uniref:Uncharacterized protein n=1 Tax=Medicago truncatula TaxID=3880 RepID=A0A072TNT6_MEDTR|nr:hypothetical protein MTR_8g442570 [Medicago truncatula]